MLIWYLSDGKPGHLNQILGLISALEKITSIKTVEISVADVKIGFFGWVTGNVSLPEYCKVREKSSPDIIIGAGHGTHKALLAISKKTSAKSLLFMSPSLPLAMFDFVCAPDHDNLPLRDNCLSTQGAINRMTPVVKQPDSGLLLIGGPSSHAGWNTDQIISQIGQIVEQSANIQWTLSTSKRTPEDFIGKLTASSNLQVMTWQQTDKNWLPEKMSSTEQIWVTPDSVSMIYEALTVEAQVGIFALKTFPTRVSMGIEKLVTEKRILHFESWKLGQKWSQHGYKLDEAKRCADWLLERLDVAT